MKVIKANIADVKINPNNPRLIKDDKFKKLVQSIKDFPEMMEIRPIVVNSDMVVLGGNMRLKACKEAGIKEVPIIIADNLTEEQQREFLIKDNVSGGEWDWDMLANEWDAEELDNWGLDIPELKDIDQAEEGEVIEFKQSVQLIPPKEYILIMCDPNSEEWEELKQWLKLGMVRRGGYKEGSSFDEVSLERVLEFKDFKERINANSNTK
jgi:ParB-like chromosome segregation protein Spo0J